MVMFHRFQIFSPVKQRGVVISFVDIGGIVDYDFKYIFITIKESNKL
jgi:hypothetical protein